MSGNEWKVAAIAAFVLAAVAGAIVAWANYG